MSINKERRQRKSTKIARVAAVSLIHIQVKPPHTLNHTCIYKHTHTRTQ